jgi:hypothetical protein
MPLLDPIALAKLMRAGIRTLALCGPRRLFVVLAVCLALAPTNSTAQTVAGPRLRVWHFAEGLTRGEFRSYFLVSNLNDRPTSVRAEYQREDGTPLTQWFGVPAQDRVSFGAGHFVGPTTFGVSFYAERDVVVERSILSNLDNEAPGQDGLSTLGFAQDGLRSWHFADGNTYGTTETFYVVRNLTDEPTAVKASFVTDIGTFAERWLALPPRGRLGLDMREVLPDRAFGASFEADRDVVVERTVFFEGQASPLGGLGHASSGTSGAAIWHFAEANTSGPYSTYFILFNPGPRPTSVEFVADGTPLAALYLPPFGRLAYDPTGVAPDTTFGATFRATGPIVAERSYYSTGDGLYGAVGHSPGLGADGRNWYFAEGNTSAGIETYFIVRSLAASPGTVRAAFHTGDGPPIVQTLPIGPNGRDAFRANDLVPGATFAISFASDVPLVVERVFYFPGSGGHNVVGVGVPSAGP